MLELDFAFRIHTLSLCEEFLICASATECQAIQLNFNPDYCSASCSDEKESTQLGEFSTSTTNCQNASVNINSSSTSRSLISHITATDGVRSSVNGADIERSGNSSAHGRSSAFNRQVQFRQEFAHSGLGLSTASNRCDELFAGPVRSSQAPCPASVEFEGKIFFCGNCTSLFYRATASINQSIINPYVA